jgi:protocatechuate 3,4-dioxygenase beta subunit
MDNDDRPIGKILTRREALAMLGAGGLAAFLAACRRLPETLSPTLEPTPTTASTQAPAVPTASDTAVPAVSTATTAPASPTSLPACIVRPEQTEGPYFVDEMLNRSDIRSDPATGIVEEGALLDLTIRLSQVSASACTALPGATVDIWHCDALGVYSGVSDSRGNTVGQGYLRGYQVSDENGVTRFTTIYPGWYPGRTVHIHFKIRLPAASGTVYDFTSQLYFDDSLSDQVFASAPYAAQGERRVRNPDDRLYLGGGDLLTLLVTPVDEGYAAVFDIGLQLE